jgi:hypothetical protein
VHNVDQVVDAGRSFVHPVKVCDIQVTRSEALADCGNKCVLPWAHEVKYQLQDTSVVQRAARISCEALMSTSLWHPCSLLYCSGNFSSDVMFALKLYRLSCISSNMKL